MPGIKTENRVILLLQQQQQSWAWCVAVNTVIPASKPQGAFRANKRDTLLLWPVNFMLCIKVSAGTLPVC